LSVPIYIYKNDWRGRRKISRKVSLQTHICGIAYQCSFLYEKKRKGKKRKEKKKTTSYRLLL
jgi:hypothetical protein